MSRCRTSAVDSLLVGLVALAAGACGPEDVGQTGVDAAPQPDAVVFAREGTVLLNRVNGGAAADAQALFVDGLLFREPLATAGGCALHPQMAREGLNAGQISVRGAKIDFEIQPSGVSPAVRYRPAPTLPADLLEAGMRLDVSTPGGADIGAFSGQVVVPSATTGFTMPTSISRTTPVALSWTSSGADQAWVWIISIPDGLAAQRLLFCRTTDSGAFEVPAQALALLPADHPRAQMVLLRVNETEVIAGDARIQLWAAQTEAMLSPVTLQP
jgi:hypothetical protein